MTKEKILQSKADHRYNISMPFGFSEIYDAMSEYATQCTAPLEARIRELEEGLREMRRCSPVLRGDTFVCFTPVKEYVNAYKAAQSLISL